MSVLNWVLEEGTKDQLDAKTIAIASYSNALYNNYELFSLTIKASFPVLNGVLFLRSLQLW